MSMVGLLLNDFTVFLAPVAAFVIGVVSFSIYTSFIRGRMLGLLLYLRAGLSGCSRCPGSTTGPLARYFPGFGVPGYFPDPVQDLQVSRDGPYPASQG